MFTHTATTAADRGRRAFLSAVPALLALPIELAAQEPDPVFAAIQTARMASDEFTAALDALDDAKRDKSLLRAADEAAERDTQARDALGRTVPTTRAGLDALIRHHARDITFLEPDTFGALAFRELAQVLPPEPQPPAPKRSPSRAARLLKIVAEAVIVAFLTGGSAALVNLPHFL